MPTVATAAFGLIAGTTATSLALAPWQGSRAAAPVPLTPAQMESIAGGDLPFVVHLSCAVGTIAVIVVPEVPTSWEVFAAGCHVTEISEWATEEVMGSYGRTRDAISDWLYNTYYFNDYHRVYDIDLDWEAQISDTGYIPTFSMQIWGELEEFYCHAQDCACDDATQCWSGMCVNGYCS
jgi:hypothetical protein